MVQLETPGLQTQADLKLRPSQEKFKEPPPRKPAVFGFVKASLPYSLGNLNKQVTVALLVVFVMVQQRGYTCRAVTHAFVACDVCLHVQH